LRPRPSGRGYDAVIVNLEKPSAATERRQELSRSQ